MTKIETMPPVPARTDDGTTNPHPLPNVIIDSDVDQERKRWELAKDQATSMAASSLLPKHLKGASQNATAANVFRVCKQAELWGMDPWAVIDESYVVRGKLAYQGKLVAALVNTRAGLRKPLTYEFTGEGQNRTVTVTGIDQDGELLIVQLTVAQAKTDNEMWRKDPDQKLCYSGAIRWARRHRPEIVMGVAIVDELEERPQPVRVIEKQAERLEAIADEVMGDNEPTDGKLFDRAPTEQEAAQ